MTFLHKPLLRSNFPLVGRARRHPGAFTRVISPRWRLVGIIVFFLLSRSAVAHASFSIQPKPDYMRGFWIRVGFTSEGRFSFGISGDAEPLSAGIEISPRSELGLVRVFAGVRDGLRFPPTCSVFYGGSGGAVVSFGPEQKLHFGLRLGAHIEHKPIADSMHPILTFPKRSEGLSYQFSWLRGAGFLHDGGAEVGLFWAPHGYCQSD